MARLSTDPSVGNMLYEKPWSNMLYHVPATNPIHQSHLLHPRSCYCATGWPAPFAAPSLLGTPMTPSLGQRRPPSSSGGRRRRRMWRGPPLQQAQRSISAGVSLHCYQAVMGPYLSNVLVWQQLGMQNIKMHTRTSDIKRTSHMSRLALLACLQMVLAMPGAQGSLLEWSTRHLVVTLRMIWTPNGSTYSTGHHVRHNNLAWNANPFTTSVWLAGPATPTRVYRTPYTFGN